MELSIFYLFIYFFGGTGVYTPGLILARQALSHLSHINSPFSFSYFSDTVSYFCSGGLRP
jgi:hypothetical protein